MKDNPAIPKLDIQTQGPVDTKTTLHLNIKYANINLYSEDNGYSIAQERQMWSGI